jgi:actin-related protein
MEYAYDGVIVVDTGSFKTLVGLAGDDKPKFEYRTVIAKNKHNDNLDLSKRDAEELWIPCYCNRTRYHDAKDVTPSSLFDNHDEFIYPVKDRRITSLNDSKILWKHVKDKIHKYAQVENTNMKNNHMLFLDHALTPKTTHVTVGEYTLEELNADSVCFVSQQLCGLISSGRTTGTVVDVGYTTTSVCPIYDTAPLVHGITDIPVGGRTISEYFCNVKSMLIMSIRKEVPKCVLKRNIQKKLFNYQMAKRFATRSAYLTLVPMYCSILVVRIYTCF